MPRLELTDEAIHDMCIYHSPSDDMTPGFHAVSQAAEVFIRVIRNHVPDSPDRSTAVRKIREARMDANSAIAHGGKY